MKSYKPSEGDSTMIESPDGEYILKKDVQPILDMLNKIKQNVLVDKDMAIEYIVNLIKNHEDYKELMDLPYEEIALHITQYNKGSYEFFFLSCRLNNEDPFESNLRSCLYLLYNQDFDVDTYNRIGTNDGKIDIIRSNLSILGLEKEAEEVSQARYNP